MKIRASNKKHLESYLGIKSWVWGGRYSLERYLYTLQRISGLGLLLYLLLHLAINGFRLTGAESWTSFMEFFEMPAVKFGEYLVLAGFIFHAFNGARLLLQELGFTLGKPKPPIYPYVDSLRKKRPIVLGMEVLVIVLLVLALIGFI